MTDAAPPPGPSSWLPELPFVRRELVTLLGQRRAFWLLVLVVLCSSLLPLSRWPESAGSGERPRDTEWVLLLLFLTQVTAALMVVPAITAGAVAGERERGTYDLLRAAPVSAVSIVIPKVLACVLYLLLLLGATAPAVSVFYFLGGVTFGTLLQCYAIAAVATVGAGIIGLTASMRSRRTSQAAVRGAGLVLLWNGGPLIVPLVSLFAVLQLASIGRRGLRVELSARGLWHVLATRLWAIAGIGVMIAASLVATAIAALPTSGCSPHYAVYAALTGDAQTGWTSAFYVVYMSLVAVGHLIFLLDTAGLPESHEAQVYEDPFAHELPAGPSALRAPRSFLTQALIDLGEGGARPLASPVFLREVRSEFHGGIIFRRCTFWGALWLFIILAALIGLHGPRWFTTLFAAAAVGAAAILSAVGGTAIAREVELGNLDFLRGTQLSMTDLLRGKLIASLASLAGLLAALAWVAGGLLFVIGPLLDAPPIAWARLGLGALVLIATIGFSAASSLFFSTFHRRSLPALVSCYAAAVGLFLGAPLLTWLLPDLAAHAAAASPILAFLELGSPGRLELAAAHVLVLSAALLAATLGLWAATMWLAERRLARDP